MGWVTYSSSRLILVGLGNLQFLKVNLHIPPLRRLKNVWYHSKHSYVKFMKFGVPISTWVKSSNLSIAGWFEKVQSVISHIMRKNLLHLPEPSPALRQYNYTDIIFFL